MAWPPTIPPANRANATVMATTHPTDHNQISAALTELVNRCDTVLPRLLGWSPIDNPASGITATHNAVQVTATVPAGGYVVEVVADIPVAWGGAPAAGDMVSIELMVDGVWTGYSTVVTPVVLGGSGMHHAQLAFMNIPAAGAHTWKVQIARFTGAQTVTLGSVGYLAVHLRGIIPSQ